MSFKKWLTIKYPGLGLLVLFFIGLCLCLSYWQYSRGQQKQRLLDYYQARTHKAPLSALSLSLNTSDLLFHRVKLVGHFDNQHHILLDNKTHAGKVGYELYTPFLIQNQAKAILIDRGFVPQGISRKVLPSLPNDAQEQEIIGMLIKPPGYFALGEMVEQANVSWPIRVQYVAINKLSQMLDKPLHPFVLLLNVPKDANKLRDELTPVTPERHQGYAFQWFALAVTLLILFVVLNRAS